MFSCRRQGGYPPAAAMPLQWRTVTHKKQSVPLLLSLLSENNIWGGALPTPWKHSCSTKLAHPSRTAQVSGWLPGGGVHLGGTEPVGPMVSRAQGPVHNPPLPCSCVCRFSCFLGAHRNSFRRRRLKVDVCFLNSALLSSCVHLPRVLL